MASKLANKLEVTYRISELKLEKTKTTEQGPQNLVKRGNEEKSGKGLKLTMSSIQPRLIRYIDAPAYCGMG